MVGHTIVRQHLYYYSPKLKSISMTNEIAKIGQYACYHVLWAEDEVANAPWGATNATINYNYAEDAECQQ